MQSEAVKRLLAEREFAKQCSIEQAAAGNMDDAIFYVNLALDLGWEAIREMDEKT